MTGHLGITAARMHAVPVARPHSEVFHLYVGPLTPTGRFVPRAARSVCNVRARRLVVLPRDGVRLDLGGRRACGRCASALAAAGRRAPQPNNRDAAVAFYDGLTLTDLVLAITMATTTDETYRIGFAMGLRFPPAPPMRPRVLEFDRDRFAAALFDVNAALLATRDRLRMAERTPEEIAAAEMSREMEAAEREQIADARRRADRINRAVDRRNRGSYLMPHERDLLTTA